MATRKKTSQRSHESKDRRLKNAATGLAVGGATALVGAVGYQYGYIPDFLDAQFVPQPDTHPEIVDGMVAVNEGLRTAAPVVVLGALATMGYYSITGKFSSVNRNRNTLAKVEFSGIDELQDDGTRKRRFKRTREGLSRVTKGAGVAACAVALTGGTSGLEHEISNGPLRPIEKASTFLGSPEQYSFILDGKSITFMDDSVVSPETVQTAVDYGEYNGVQVVPFNKTLMNVDGKSSLQISIPDEIFAEVAGVDIDQSCNNIPVIYDDTEGAKKGDVLNINGTEAEVVAIEDDMAHIGRSIAIMSDTDMKECLMRNENQSYFGVIVPDIATEDIQKILAGTGADAVSAETFKENNREFWRANVTPIALQLMGYIGLFGAVAMAGYRKSALLRNVKEVGMMNGSGVDMKEIRAIEDRRALSEALRATAIGAPAIPLVAGIFNFAERGLQVGTGPREIAVGSAVVLASKLVAGRSAVRSFGKNLDVKQAVKG